MTRRGIGVVGGLVCALLCAAPASAAISFGVDLTTGAGVVDATFCGTLTFTAGASGPTCVSVLGGTSGGAATAPVSGIVTSWSTRLSGGGTTTGTLRVAHDPGGTASSASLEPITYAGTSASVAVPMDGAIQTFQTRLPIVAGDLIGFNSSGGNVIYRPATGLSRKLRVYRGSGDGTSPAEGSLAAVDATGAEPPLRATIEADADHDGFGDETQDQRASDATTQGPCAVPDTTAPETTISKGPKKKTTAKSATFEFSSNEAGSTFECSLDGAPFKACTSPDTVKAKKPGKHNFQVRARDAAGNVDQTEAAYSWKVKKKRKHHH